MSISAISAGSTSQMSGSNLMAQMKQNFDDLGSALSSGNLDDAKKAFAKLQKNAPSGGNGKNPSEIDDLKKALDSGDLKGAQEAYSKIQDKMSQGPPAGAPAKGVVQSEPVDTVQLSSAKSDSQTSSTDSKTYDKMDLNKDGKVTAMETMEYNLAHANDTSSATATTDSANSEGKASSTDSKSYDKKDINKDGAVSAQEEQKYDQAQTISENTETVLTSDKDHKKFSVETYA